MLAEIPVNIQLMQKASPCFVPISPTPPSLEDVVYAYENVDNYGWPQKMNWSDSLTFQALLLY